MARTKRTAGEEDDDPHRQPPRRPGKAPIVDAPKRKKQKRRSADEELTQEQANMIIDAHKAGRVDHPIWIAEPEAAGTRRQWHRRATLSTSSEPTETPVRSEERRVGKEGR